jgi:hypothetical protein
MGRYGARNSLIPVFILILTVLAFPNALFSQEDEEDTDVILLLKGPNKRRGIDVLPPNVIPYFYGEYQFRNHTVIVNYTTEAIVPSGTWGQTQCAPYAVKQYSHPVKPNLWDVYFYQREDRWFVFMILPVEIEDPCLFISSFIKKLTYFIGITREEQTVPLPAVIELE